MIFTYDRPEIPVDTHVHRVGGRLGLFRPNASFEEAHDEMLAITPPEDAYEFHINLIHHGRALCRPRPALRRVRRCGGCAPGTGPTERTRDRCGGRHRRHQ